MAGTPQKVGGPAGAGAALSPQAAAAGGVVSVQELGQLLHHTAFNPDNTQRAAAERRLAELEAKTGYQSSLLQLLTLKEAQLEIKQAASVRLKNIVQESWALREGALQKISDTDRKIIKDNILEIIIFQQAKEIRTQLLECLHHISNRDFPELWPDLLPNIMKNFKSNDTTRIYGALCTLYKVYKKYQFKSPENRAPMMKLVELTFPTLLALFQHVITLDNPQGHEFCRQLVKIFFLATQLQMPPFLEDQKVFTAWMTLIIKLFDRVYPPQAYVKGQALREIPLWKCKKWCGRIYSRIFTRFGRPNYVQDARKPFAHFFFNTWAAPCMNSILGFLKFHSQTGLATNAILQSSYVFLSDAITHSALYKLLKPHLKFVMFESLLPVMCLTKDDLHTWSTDPHEFVRKSLDVMEEFVDPRISGAGLLTELVRVRTRDTLNPCLAAIASIVNTYAAAPNEKKNFIQKEGALRMFGNMRKLLLGQKQLKDAIEKMITIHVLPEFRNPHGFMRARACWVIGQFSKLKWASKEAHTAAIKCVCDCLRDKDLPVKLEASVAISRIVQGDDVIEFLRPMIPLIFEQFFVLFDEIGNEEVVATLGGLINQFQTEIIPYALQLFNKLSVMSVQLLKADAGDDESALTCIQCLRSMNAILYACSTLPQLYPDLERIAAPLIDKLLCEDGIEFYEETLEMITCFTYFPPAISQFMWSLLPRMCEAYHKWAPDYINNMLAPMDNFISRGTQIFLTSQQPNFVKMIMDICVKLLNDKTREIEGQYACKLLESLLAHCRGKIDGLVPSIVYLATQKLVEPGNKQLKLLLIDVIGGAAYYNPALFVAICNKAPSADFTQSLFNFWLSHLPAMKTSGKHMKMSVLGLSSLMLVPGQQYPKLLAQAFPKVLNELVGTLKRLQHWEDNKGDVTDDDDEDDEDDEEDGAGAKAAGGAKPVDPDKAAAKAGAVDADSDDDEDDDEEEDTVDLKEDDDLQEGEEERHLQDLFGNPAIGLNDHIDEDNFESPLDDVDEFVLFAQALEQLKGRDGAWYNNWAKLLDADQRAVLVKVMNSIPGRQKTLAEALAKKEQEKKEQAVQSVKTMAQLRDMQQAKMAHMQRAHSVGASMANPALGGAAAAGAGAAASPQGKKP